mgnify:CR=1 FL=1
MLDGPSPASFDLVLLHNDPSFALAELSHLIQADQLVWDGSNSYWRRKKWAANSEQLEVATYDVQEEGALIIQW